MGMMDWFNEQIYILFSMHYYEVYLYLGKKQVGRIIQLVSFSPTYIVDFHRKLAWPIVNDAFFFKGNRLIGHYEIDYALPLVETEYKKETELTNNIIQTEKIVKLSGKVSKEQKKMAEPKKLIEMSSIGKINGKEVVITKYNLPPHMLFEKFNAGFVTNVLSKSKGTDWTMVFIVGFVVLIIIVFMLAMVFGVFKA
jgi:hypothetical protein